MNSNIIINIPHSSTYIPEPFLEGVAINKEELQQEVELLTDLYTDDLFANKDCNIIRADISRIVCDMERFRDDSKEQMSNVGMGVIYTQTSKGKKLIEFDSEYRNTILKEYYDSYYNKFEELTSSILNRYGRCIIIDGHSFSVELLKRLGIPYKNSPDICIGFDDEFCDSDILNILKQHFEKNGLAVALNYPYVGSIVPNRYYNKKDSRVKSLMIEVNKSIYLDDNNQKNANYSKIKIIIQKAIKKVLLHEKNITVNEIER